MPFIPRPTERALFTFLRKELPYYRVEYDINRGGTSTHIKTPRYTVVFGLDETARFDLSGKIVDSQKGTPMINEPRYSKIAPRPIPACLDMLRLYTEDATGCQYNFCLVNYYANGGDSISYHSDDESFLGDTPAIASLSLGARRDFLLKHKPRQGLQDCETLKLSLSSGDMVLMRGSTQANWLHSIPKRTGKNADDGGRINITFRKAVVKAGTENYYRYNVGNGPVWRWDETSKTMKLSKNGTD